MQTFRNLIGKKVSVLIDAYKRSGIQKESYVGIVMGYDEGFLTLNINLDGKNFLDKIVVQEDQILSIWIYKGESNRP